MGAWAVVLQSISADNIPVSGFNYIHASVSHPLPFKQSYYFARDDRVYKAFTTRLQQHKTDIDRKCPRQLRHQLAILKSGFEGRKITFRVRPASSFAYCQPKTDIFPFL